MNIAVLREEKKLAYENLESKKRLVAGLSGKVETIRADGSRLLADRDRLQEKIDLFDEVLETERLTSARDDLQKNREAIRQNADFLEATQKTFDKETANIQELEERILGIKQRIMLVIADREARIAKEAAFVVNRAWEAAKLAGAFTTYEEFFHHTFPVNEEDRLAMRAEFENEAK